MSVSKGSLKVILTSSSSESSTHVQEWTYRHHASSCSPAEPCSYAEGPVLDAVINKPKYEEILGMSPVVLRGVIAAQVLKLDIQVLPNYYL
ncbi:hypothetical protein llap_10047 [Limosa lapponica baueri]|uniref:Uncharacterized protein n=1 Tax=Limosa lapponica baueri TaxID=1758121 RepID=A0A2I0U0W1_LIMLA|nr:hypothetical protein llap_10047 [Limosa lapponica baueri]